MGWMMTEVLGGTWMMIGFPDVAQTMTGDHGGTWTMTGSPDGLMMTGYPGGVMMGGLVPGDRLSGQVAGERKKKPEKRVGVHLENQDHQKNENGIEIKKEIIKIVMKMTRSQREMGIERIASDGPGMKVAGEKDQLRRRLAGEIQVAVMIGMTVAVI